MPTLTQFHTLVADMLKRGTTLSSQIPVATRQAARWIERNHTLQYMKKYASVTLDPESAQPRAISLPNSRFKGVRFFKILEDDGTYDFLVKGDAQQIGRTKTAKPGVFWLDGVDFIWFDNTPDQEYSCEIGYQEFTDWDALASSDTPWLLANAEDLMMFQTCYYMAPFMRDPGLMTMFDKQKQEAIRTLLLADEEFEQGPARNEVMQYGKSYP